MRPGPETMVGRAALNKAVVNFPDVLADPTYSAPITRRPEAGAVDSAYRCCAMESRSASIAVGRREPGAFPAHQVALLKTFADQAVIAIENVRLFKELEARNADLTEALEQQTATSDILRVISQSQTDVQPVFDTIVAAALKLCQCQFGERVNVRRRADPSRGAREP